MARQQARSGEGKARIFPSPNTYIGSEDQSFTLSWVTSLGSSSIMQCFVYSAFNFIFNGVVIMLLCMYVMHSIGPYIM